MKQVALYDAKNKLSSLIQEVEEKGVEVIITRHGKPVARLSPVRRLSAADRSAAIERMIYLRDGFTDAGLEPFDWKAAVEDGRE
ncbi:MAG TPA: type II toxin-antitoxin system prevent-host-death family antitoxin [Vitreimonas sp.]|uniref:type II toxin-antitoxin system Phd/YefM family antitoxin n=1 Tax=Vitreimonas sp. TaxID=3069702 RepID=UPI002D5D00C9|nr:type II toxin-antitoxin system prevent-host-death family antitoxin [Vitreimonas sp.]HYD86616.1 type II toxin-antitoxin system prevent-host-death family antitoxin [Vitreimonas sp.]